MTYYAQRKSILNGEPQTVNNRYGDRRVMEQQFHLYCANACDGTENPYNVDSIEWGSTLEHGAIERKCYVKETQAQEEEPEAQKCRTPLLYIFHLLLHNHLIISL